MCFVVVVCELWSSVQWVCLFFGLNLCALVGKPLAYDLLFSCALMKEDQGLKDTSLLLFVIAIIL